MEKSGWSVSLEGNWYSVESMLFTYSEEEMEQNRINKNNADLILNPLFIPVYPQMIREGYSYLESIIFWFINFFLNTNDRFYCSNEQLWEMLWVSDKTISLAVKKLKDNWLIDISYKIKSNWGKIRFISRGNLKNVISDFTKMYSPTLQKCKGIENKIIENNIIKENNIKEKKQTPSVSELVEAYKHDELLVRQIWDEHVVRQRAEYKQAKKDRAYKTTEGFIQQLRVAVDTVRFWQPRGDTSIRLSFALNQATENEWKKMYWNTQIEQEYQGRKKTLTL